MQRAFDITQASQWNSEAGLNDLLQPTNFFKDYHYYLMVEVHSLSSDEVTKWYALQSSPILNSSFFAFEGW